jgi:predicted AAA+ superfamily ATPase
MTITMNINRSIINELVEWKGQEERKPLLLMGARQTGKTWIMKEFGKQYYNNTAYFNFESNTEIHDIFNQTLNPERIIKDLSLYTDSPITAGDTLIIFDEVQSDERVLNSLKYFCEEAPQYHIIAAGSLLGVAVSYKHMSVPVGKVQTLQMHPITFKEYFAIAEPKYYKYIEEKNDLDALPTIILNRLVEEYRRYMICGGMPQATRAMLENKGMNDIEDILKSILDLYTVDFSKYASQTDILRINNIWQSLPSQLSKENRKFIYNVVRPGARARDYEIAIFWLKEAGLIHQIFSISKPDLPLSAYKDLSAFKIYACDCGLTRRMANLSAEVILNPAIGYTEFKGALAENVVLQSLLAQYNSDIYYWNSGNMAEVDFVLQDNELSIPIEVKSDTRISGKSLSIYYNKYHPKVRIRYSMNNLKYNDGLLSMPLPLTDWTQKFVNMVR